MINKKNNLSEDIFIEALGTNTIITNVGEMIKTSDKDKEQLETVESELDILGEEKGN